MLTVFFLMLSKNVISQSKKKQIEILQNKVDSLLSVLDIDKKISLKKEIEFKEQISILQNQLRFKEKELNSKSLNITNLENEINKRNLQIIELKNQIDEVNTKLEQLKSIDNNELEAKDLNTKINNENVFYEFDVLTTDEFNLLSSFGYQGLGRILISKNVKRYYEIIEGNKINVRNELIYEKNDNGIIAEEYISYNVSFTGENPLNCSYSYSAGHAQTVEGSIIVVGENFWQTEISWGTGAMTMLLIKNNKVIINQTKNF